MSKSLFLLNQPHGKSGPIRALFMADPDLMDQIVDSCILVNLGPLFRDRRDIKVNIKREYLANLGPQHHSIEKLLFGVNPSIRLTSNQKLSLQKLKDFQIQEETDSVVLSELSSVYSQGHQSIQSHQSLQSQRCQGIENIEPENIQSHEPASIEISLPLQKASRAEHRKQLRSQGIL